MEIVARFNGERVSSGAAETSLFGGKLREEAADQRSVSPEVTAIEHTPVSHVRVEIGRHAFLSACSHDLAPVGWVAGTGMEWWTVVGSRCHGTHPYPSPTDSSTFIALHSVL
jgi:hypothetical protein